MEIIPATPEQIAEFKTAAAARYKEQGVTPEHAEALFQTQLAKVAAELGIDPKDAACGSSHGAKKPVKKKSKKVEKMASVIADGLGRKRKTK